MYIKLVNGQPEKYSIEQLRLDNPNTSFPDLPSNDLLALWNVYPYVILNQPEYDYLTQTAVAAPITQINGVWTQAWVIENLPIEQAEQGVRAQRDELLLQTDWAALSDRVLTPEMAAYRQALRDVTKQQGFPYNVVWPIYNIQ